MFKKLGLSLVILIYHFGILEGGILIVESLQDKREIAKSMYETYFVPRYKDKLGKEILCDSIEIFEKDQFKIHSGNYFQFHCENGLATVYEIEKGLFRSAMLANWRGD